jgi:hypothetical protein
MSDKEPVQVRHHAPTLLRETPVAPDEDTVTPAIRPTISLELPAAPDEDTVTPAIRPAISLELPAAPDEDTVTPAIRPTISLDLPAAPDEDTVAPAIRPAISMELPVAPDEDTVTPAIRPAISMELPAAPDEPQRRKQFSFAEAAWIPDADALAIGEKNLSDIQNLRYTDEGLEGVQGYSKINTTALTTYLKIRAGIQLRAPFTTKSRVLVQAYNTGLTASQVLQNLTAIPSQGDFAATALHTDAAGAGRGRFAQWPNHHVAYCNGVENRIYAGDETACAFVSCATSLTDHVDYTEPVRTDETTDAASLPLAVVQGSEREYALGRDLAANAADYQALCARFKAQRTGKIHGVTFKLKKTGAPAGNLYAMLYTSTGTYPDNYPNTQEGANSNLVACSTLSTSYTDIHFTFAADLPDVTAGTYYYIILKADATYAYVDGVTEVVAGYFNYSTETKNTAYQAAAGAWNNWLSNRAQLDFQVHYKVYLYLGTTRAAAGFKFSIDAAAKNTRTTPDLLAEMWAGSAWAYCANITDGTVSTGSTMAQTGTVSFDSTDGVAQPRLINNQVLHFYRISWTDFLLRGKTTATEWQQDPTTEWVEICDGTVDQLWPMLLPLSGDKVLCVYEGDGGDPFCKLSDDNGATWGSAVEVVSGTSGVSRPGATMLDDGTVLCALKFAGAWDADGDIRVYSSSDDGATWALLSTPVAACYAPRILALSNGTVLFVYNKMGAGPITVCGKISADDGATWGSEFTIRSAGPGVNAQNFFLFQTRNGTVFCGNWGEEGAGPYALKVCKSYDMGLTWSAPATIVTAANYNAGAPCSMGYDLYGVLYLAFHNDTDRNVIHYCTSGDDGATWSHTAPPTAPLPLVHGADICRSPGLALVDGVLSMAFSYRTAGAGNYRLMFAQYTETAATIHAQPPRAYQLTADLPFQSMKNAWCGVPLLCTGFKVFDGTLYADYTAEMADDSMSTGTGTALDAFATTKSIIIQTSARAQAFTFHFIAANDQASVMTLERYQGGFVASSYQEDGTSNAGKSFGQNATVFIGPDPDDTKLSVDGSDPFYTYRITFSATLGANVELYYVTAIEAPEDLKNYKFPFMFLNRPMLCGYPQGREGNRVDYGMTNTTDVFNGPDSSLGTDNEALYFGGAEDLTCACEVYNRLGSSIYSFALFCKEFETYLLNGYDPATYKIYPVSTTYGCPAPETMDTCQVDISPDAASVRSIAMWISHRGPVIFDSGGLTPVRGIECYFDQADSRCVNDAALANACGKFHPTRPEYHVLLPSGTGQTTNNVWLVYNIQKKRWFKVVPSAAASPYPQALIPVTDLTGGVYCYGSRDNGYLMRLNADTPAWDGTASVQFAVLADQLASGDLWDLIRLNRFKLLGVCITENITASITHYADGAAAGTALTAVALKGSNRYFRSSQGMNLLAWSHQLKISATVSSELRGMRLLGWGLLYQIVREDK